MNKHNSGQLANDIGMAKDFRVVGYADLRVKLGDVSNGIRLPVNPTEHDDVLEFPIKMFPSKSSLEQLSQNDHYSLELHFFMDCQLTQMEEEVSIFLTDFHKRKKRCIVGLRSRIHRGYKLFRELSLHNELNVRVRLNEKRLLVRSNLQELPVLEHDGQRIRICAKEELYTRNWFPSKYEFSHNYGKGKGINEGGVYIAEETAIEEASLHAEEETELGKATETISVFFINEEGSGQNENGGLIRAVFLISSQICRDGNVSFHLRDVYFLEASLEYENGAVCYKIGEHLVRRDEEKASFIYWNNLCDAIIEQEKEAIKHLIVGRLIADADAEQKTVSNCSCSVCSSQDTVTTVRGAEITD